MSSPKRQSFFSNLLFGVVVAMASGQILQAKPVAVGAKIEPGLESAYRWKWWVVESPSNEWGLPLPEKPVLAALPANALVTSKVVTPEQQATYEVKKGDVLVRIAKKFHLTVDELKKFNMLQSDMLHIGDVLRIPNADERRVLSPPPTPTPKPAVDLKPVGGPKSEGDALSQRDNVVMQIFLDREHFSPGPIAGTLGPMFQKIQHVYLTVHPEASEGFLEKAKASVVEPYVKYRLRDEDFRFILPPKAEKAEKTPGKSGSKPTASPEEKSHSKTGMAARKTADKVVPIRNPAPIYEDMVSVPMLAYRSPWEFVAERFHCEQSFLRTLNPKLRSIPLAGDEFIVPNVRPFEIESAFSTPLQPKADPQVSVTAEICDLSRLEISRGGVVVAVFPIGMARPGIRGRGVWTVLDAIARPRMATLQALREPTSPPPISNFYVGPQPDESHAPTKPVLSREQYLPAGPMNPVGIVWINLAKAKAKDPLPYGLHGTSIPDKMRSLEGIGGIRLTNWDILQAVHLLPQGTAIQWK